MPPADELKMAARDWIRPQRDTAGDWITISDNVDSISDFLQSIERFSTHGKDANHGQAGDYLC